MTIYQHIDLHPVAGSLGALLDFLSQHLTIPEFQCRFHWRCGSLAMWDNRCTLHRVVDDGFEKGRRTMYRLSLKENP